MRRITCVPRRCGGVPLDDGCFTNKKMCSPQVRGCSCVGSRPPCRRRVFPAGAGVFPYSFVTSASPSRVPRRCGGVPSMLGELGKTGRCSPQVRGCSLTDVGKKMTTRVFPAGAGVFPDRKRQAHPGRGVPRRCGGVPIKARPAVDTGECSPQVRGCSCAVGVNPRVFGVFPAGAGVFPGSCWVVCSL